MKKPSETIKKLDKTVHFGSREATITDIHNELVSPMLTIESIISYLDEEKERVNGILHEIVKNMGGYIPVGSKRLHQMIDKTLSEPSEKQP